MSSRGGAAPTTAPVGWVFLDRHRHDGYTIRWRRGLVSTPRQMQTDDDPEGISLPTQREACQRKARELGLAIADEYIEPGNTGTAIAKRPVFRQMMQRIRDERDVDHIITYSTSRMNRNWKENGAVLLELAGLGVTLVSATENVNADTAEGSYSKASTPSSMASGRGRMGMISSAR
jgi:DNA invertase Pin-like site-specific DNA recombinase